MEPAAAAPERTLVLGWNRRAPTIIREWLRGPGSEIVIAADLGAADLALEDLKATLTHTRVRVIHADTTSRRVLDRLTSRCSITSSRALC